MYQVDGEAMGEDGDDGDEEVDIEYEGIEGMEHQIEDDGDEMVDHDAVDGRMMGDNDDDDAVDDQMMGEGEGEDDMIEIDEDQLQEILAQH